MVRWGASRAVAAARPPPSATPRLAAMPQLVVAMHGAPACSIAMALIGSQALGATRAGSCRARKARARSRRALVLLAPAGVVVMVYLLWLMVSSGRCSGS